MKRSCHRWSDKGMSRPKRALFEGDPAGSRVADEFKGILEYQRFQ